MMDRNDDPELWEFMGHAPTPKLSPVFARNVVREIRRNAESRDRVSAWFRPILLFRAAAVALLVSSAFLVAHRSAHAPGATQTAAAYAGTVDADLIADVDELVSGEDDASEEIAAL